MNERRYGYWEGFAAGMIAAVVLAAVVRAIFSRGTP